MRGKRAKEFRRYAENATVGESPEKLKRILKQMKAEYFWYTHQPRPPAPTPSGFFLCRAKSAERQRLIQSWFDPKA